MALDGKPEDRTLILPSAVWPVEFRTIDSRGQQLISRVTKTSMSTDIYIVQHNYLDLNTGTEKTYKKQIDKIQQMTERLLFTSQSYDRKTFL
jgi:hypothetical protein